MIPLTMLPSPVPTHRAEPRNGLVNTLWALLHDQIPSLYAMPARPARASSLTCGKMYRLRPSPSDVRRLTATPVTSTIVGIIVR